MRVLANSTRLAILRLTTSQEMAVSDLAQQLDLAQATTSQHLRVLRDGGLVSVRVDRNHRYYRTDNQRLRSLTGYLESLWSVDLAALKTAAEQIDRQEKEHD